MTLWRAASNCLATKSNLCIKKVLNDNNCPLCGVFAETELHLLVSCQFAWACWEFSGFIAADSNPVSLLSWLSSNAARMDDEKLSRVVMLCWAIWSARNDLLWKNRARSVKSVVDFAQSSLHQFLKARAKQLTSAPRKPGDASEIWTKPTVGIKLNVDAALFVQELKHGYGCVIRNTDGDLVSVFAGAKQGKVSPEIAEAMGIREALSWLKNHNFSHATVESDSLVCVAAIRSNEKLNSGFGFIVEECKLILRSLLNVTLCFVNRSANRAAHYIARHSLSLAERIVIEIYGMCARFWWGGDNDFRKMHLGTWPHLCWHKSNGRMGFRNMFLFNQFPFAKQAGRLYDSLDSLVACVMKGFYYPHSSIVNVLEIKRASFLWKSVLYGAVIYGRKG
ncbi:uncharacterized protein LOC133037192 [Cannabis sativa]|uniref:uncharacterized protein LOC133037192 n=1 Tax=Cannabis sativa TaxID=3483 RepID=UPI0029C9E3C3|nr:uncharacterized protein LOC133037192 [Cannabis sativa]